MLTPRSQIDSKGALHHQSQSPRHIVLVGEGRVSKQSVGYKAGAPGVPLYCQSAHDHDMHSRTAAAQYSSRYSRSPVGGNREEEGEEEEEEEGEEDERDHPWIKF